MLNNYYNNKSYMLDLTHCNAHVKILILFEFQKKMHL